MGKATNYLHISGLVNESIKPEFQEALDKEGFEVTEKMINRRSVTESELNDLFNEYGAKEVKLIIDKETGESRGFAFVKFDEGDTELAKLAKTNLEGKELIKGVPIEIVFANERATAE